MSSQWKLTKLIMFLLGCNYFAAGHNVIICKMCPVLCNLACFCSLLLFHFHPFFFLNWASNGFDLSLPFFPASVYYPSTQRCQLSLNQFTLVVCGFILFLMIFHELESIFFFFLPPDSLGMRAFLQHVYEGVGLLNLARLAKDNK